MAPLLDIFGRRDANAVRETERGILAARLVTEQVGGEVATR